MGNGWLWCLRGKYVMVRKMVSVCVIECQFISLDDQKREAICLCFEMFRDTLPAGCEYF